jgi:GMP synthase-like glutamine amidotransferase
MKPVAICRYAPHEGPGYFATYLSARSLPWRLVKLDEGEPLPAVGSYAGLAMMGGAMSVNDELPWIPAMLDLVRRSVAADVPVIGHCLGGQLLSKALGGEVTRTPVKEIGWGEIRVLDTPLAALWGPAEKFVSYHWHGQTFSLPPGVGAQRIWSSAYCENQAFCIGNSIAMQCHIEMTEAMVESWCGSGVAEIEESFALSPAVQTPQQMREGMAAKLDALHHVADRVYTRWIHGVTNP